jgi:glutathione synthase/RimK-type ligase-like ATP-grasp enzyme
MKIATFYIRQLGYFWPIPQEELTKEEWIARYGKYWEYVTNERENLSLKHSMIRMLSREKFVVNPYDSFMYHRLKPLQLWLFKKNNLPVPDFVAGNEPSAVKVGETICKALAGGIHAELIDDKNFEDYKNMLVTRPGLFQKYIKGKNIRAYVVGDSFLGAGELISGPQIDSRIEQKGVKVVEVPKEVKEVAIKAKELLGMHFSGIDFILSDKGEYYLLECNPSPMFYGFELITKIPVSQKLADFLVKNKKR